MREIAQEVGIRVPKTITPSNLDQVREAKSNLHFPVLVKPRRGHGGIGISKVNKPSQLPDIYLKTIRRFNISKPTELPIIQEFIQGKTLEMGMLFNHGELVAKFSYLVPRLFFRLEHEDPESTDTLYRLGKHLKWHGRIHAGFIIEETTHRSYLVDINPRHSGVVGYAIMSGVEFPYLLYRIALDGKVEPVLKYERETTSRWLWGDLYNLLKYIRRGELDQALEVLKCRAPLDFWDPSDPIPFLTLPAYYLTQLFRTGTMQPLIEKY
jgi:predicted ATP-grasp superfamily ATP-dependent carboligase